MSHENTDLDYDEFGLPKCTKCDARMILPVSTKWENHSSVQAECPACGAVLVKSEVIAGSALFHQPDEIVVAVDENGKAIAPVTKDPMNLPTGRSSRKDKGRGPWNISTREKPGIGWTPNDIRKMNARSVLPGAVEKNPLEGYTVKELQEISVALDLLDEYPATKEYVVKLRDDLRIALLSRQTGAVHD